ncbi:MAG: energy transducer TonB, partial [Planctomycetota bacterium]|nr:energy transducer TonB [Planctomycetota bacterium]
GFDAELSPVASPRGSFRPADPDELAASPAAPSLAERPGATGRDLPAAAPKDWTGPASTAATDATASSSEGEVDGAPADLGALAGDSSVVRSAPALVYPLLAQRRGVEGTARIGVEVAADGGVARAWVIRSSGSRLLDRAARENLAAWRFDPEGLAVHGRLFHKDVRFELR